MKKLFILAAVALMALGATMAFAQGRGMGYGHGHGHGMGMGANGNCMMNNGGPGMNNGGGFGIGGATGFVNITEEEAVAKVQAYIDSNQLKGYTVNGTSSFVSPRGFDSYIVKVSDNGGNNFVFMVGARGFVRGPILESNFNAWQQPAPIPAPAQ